MAYRGFRPHDVDRVIWKRLTLDELRMMLRYLGERRIPDKKEPKVAMMLRWMERDRDRVQKAWDTVILRKEPEPGTEELDPDKLGPIGKAALEDAKKKLDEHVAALTREFDKDELRSKVHAAVSDLKDEIRTLAEAALADAVPRELVIRRPGRKTVKIDGVMPEWFDKMVRLGNQRVPIMLVGPTGCGKTFVAEKLADALSLKRFGSQSCSEGTAESEFIGRLLPIGTNGKFVHCTTPFLECYEKGGVFLFDEIDASDPNLMVFLNKAIAQDAFDCPQRYNKTTVKKHKDFVCVAAANTFGHGADAQYVGRNQLDAATLDRFRTGTIYCDYSDAVEEALVQSRDLLVWGRAVREAIRKHSMRRTFSTRTFKDMNAMTVNEGWKRADWETAFFAGWSREETHMIRNELRGMLIPQSPIGGQTSAN